MKDFTKSMASAGLAGVLFGARQLANVVAQPPRNGDSDRATASFNAMAQAAADQCGESLRETFHAFDRVQRAAIDTGFRFLSLEAFSSYGSTEMLSGLARQANDQMRRWVGTSAGCGCSRTSPDHASTGWGEDRAAW